MELLPPPTVYLADGVEVLVVECLPKDDRLLPLSRTVWQGQLKRLVEHGAPRIRCQYIEVGSEADLRGVLAANRANILVVSAHGIYDEAHNVAMVEVGSDRVLDLPGQLPPVVVFSACSAWPRGVGAVSVADLALRRGAMAVVGTLFPVDLVHNALTMTRMFVSLAAAQRGAEPLFTFADVVFKTLASNPVVDLFLGSHRMRKWGFGEGPGGRPPLVEFMLERSSGRLRMGHVFADTEKVVQETADACGVARGASVRQFLETQSYVPESLYYAMIGWPERIILQPRTSGEKAIREKFAEPQ